MSRIILFTLLACLSLNAFGQELSLEGFKNRFSLARNDEGRVTHIKLKKATKYFTLKPFIEQIKNDLLGEQNALMGMSEAEREAEIDEMLYDMGLDPYSKDSEGSEEARHFKNSLLNIKNIDVEAAFNELNQKDFWAEFQARLNEAFLFLDPTVLANLEDARFFYKKAVTHKVVVWALEQAQKRFSNLPILGIATFVIVRVHDMMLEQRHFHHNMLLHYFENVKETELGMTKEEVDRATSSIYEYRIDATNIFESNRANADWLNYGMNKFYMMVRSGNVMVRDWAGPFSSMAFKDIKKVNFGFAEVTHDGARKIYHLHHKAHMFSGKPSLAYDYSNPKKVKRNRALLNLGGVVLGFLKIPQWIKGNVNNFLHSFYVQQVRSEGALVGYFESTGNTEMVNSIYRQRANLYIQQ